MGLITKIVATFILPVPLTASAAEPDRVPWSALPDPAAQIYEDPFLDLSAKALDALGVVVRVRDQLARGDVAPETRARVDAQLADALELLAVESVDAEWMISQRWIVADRRKRAASAGNKALDGSDVKLAGFAIPARPDADGTRIAYLVPLPGMCSHMPPPNPNQLVKLKLSNDWYPQRVYEPVLVSGRLVIDPTERSTHVIDGIVPMVSTWRLDTVDVVTVASKAPRPSRGPFQPLRR